MQVANETVIQRERVLMCKFIFQFTYHSVPNRHVILNSDNPKGMSHGGINNRSANEENPRLGTKGS
jgi:hypothetical protein